MAKAGIFKVYLKSMIDGARAQGGSSGWGEGMMYAIGSEIKGLLLQVVAERTCPFGGADYTWEVDVAAMQPHDQLVYFVNRSLIERVDGTQTVTTAGATFLVSGSGMISEVNMSVFDGDPHVTQKAARVAFHELMHAKLDADPAHQVVPNLHIASPRTPGTGEGLALHNVEWYTQLTPNNKTLFAPNLKRRVPQYTAAASELHYMRV